MYLSWTVFSAKIPIDIWSSFHNVFHRSSSANRTFLPEHSLHTRASSLSHKSFKGLVCTTCRTTSYFSTQTAECSEFSLLKIIHLSSTISFKQNLININPTSIYIPSVPAYLPGHFLQKNCRSLEKKFTSKHFSEIGNEPMEYDKAHFRGSVRRTVLWSKSSRSLARSCCRYTGPAGSLIVTYFIDAELAGRWCRMGQPGPLEGIEARSQRNRFCAGRARQISRWRFEFHRKERILFLFLAAFAFLLSARRGEKARGLEWTKGSPMFPREVQPCVFARRRVYTRLRTITRSSGVDFWRARLEDSIWPEEYSAHSLLFPALCCSTSHIQSRVESIDGFWEQRVTYVYMEDAG